MKRRVATSHPFFSPLASFGGSVRTIFFNDGWFFQQSTFCHPFFQGLYRTNNFFIRTSFLLWGPFLCIRFFSYLKVMHLFLSQKEDSHPLSEVYCVVFIRCIIHLLPLIVICCYSLSFVVTRWTTHLSFHKQSQCLAKIYYYLM